MNRIVIVILRILIVGLFAGAVFGQVRFLPVVVASEIAEAGGGQLAVLYPALGIAAIACVQAMLLAVWMLLGMVRTGAIFQQRAFRWVDVIIGAGAVSTALGVTFLVLLNILSPEFPPGILGIILGAVLANAALVLLMLVMRRLLRSATAFRAELDEVV